MATRRHLVNLASTLAVLALVSVAGVVFAEPLTELFAAGHHAEPGRFELTVSMTRWLFPYIFFMGMAALSAGALNAHRRFAVPALAPALRDVERKIQALRAKGVG